MCSCGIDIYSRRKKCLLVVWICYNYRSFLSTEAARMRDVGLPVPPPGRGTERCSLCEVLFVQGQIDPIWKAPSTIQIRFEYVSSWPQMVL